MMLRNMVGIGNMQYVPSIYYILVVVPVYRTIATKPYTQSTPCTNYRSPRESSKSGSSVSSMTSGISV